MDIHPNEIFVLKKKIDGLISLVEKLTGRLGDMENLVSEQSTSIRELQRKVSVEPESDAPARKRPAPVTLKKKDTKQT